jgi:SAM-dependent methyltransferase
VASEHRLALVEIGASEKPWNSATTLYIARKIQEIAGGRRLQVLDMGCGQGQAISLLQGYGHALYGFDLPDKSEALKAALGPIFGDAFDEHIRFMADERCIPFESGHFDIIYANQVFEHVRFLDQMLAECARVLKPDGSLITLFPLATYPLEGHSLIPFAHWLPPGRFRRAYLRAFLTLGIGRRLPGWTVSQAVTEWDDRLQQFTFYRFMNEFQSLFTYYFDECSLDAGEYVRAKADLLQTSGVARNRRVGRLLERVRGKRLASLVTHGFMAVFVARRPKAVDRRQRVVEWRH